MLLLDGVVGSRRSLISNTIYAPTQSVVLYRLEVEDPSYRVCKTHRLNQECPARDVASASGPPVSFSDLLGLYRRFV